MSRFSGLVLSFKQEINKIRQRLFELTGQKQVPLSIASGGEGALEVYSEDEFLEALAVQLSEFNAVAATVSEIKMLTAQERPLSRTFDSDSNYQVKRKADHFVRQGCARSLHEQVCALVAQNEL